MLNPELPGLDPLIVTAAELGAHEAYTQAVLDHGISSGGKIGDLGYDPARYSFQSLLEFYTPPRQIPNWVPEQLAMNGLKFALALSVGSIKIANGMAAVLNETESFEGSDRSIAEEVKWRRENGQLIAVVSDHLETTGQKADYRDPAKTLGALILADGSLAARENSVVFLGKNISRQSRGRKFNGQPKPMISLMRWGMGIIWVTQDTDSQKELQIPQDARSITNDGASAVLSQARKDKGGAYVSIVPAGSATNIMHDEVTNSPYLYRPRARAAVSTLTGFDAILPLAYKNGRLFAGPVHAVKDFETASRHDQLGMAIDSLRRLAVLSATAMEMPMSFETFETKTSREIAYPEVA